MHDEFQLLRVLKPQPAVLPVSDRIHNLFFPTVVRSLRGSAYDKASRAKIVDFFKTEKLAPVIERHDQVDLSKSMDMTRKSPNSHATRQVWRYVHDIATGEFVNMGVALYAPEVTYVGATCNPRYGRLSRFFMDVNGEHLRSVMRYVQGRFEEYSIKLRGELPLNGHPKNIMEMALGIPKQPRPNASRSLSLWADSFRWTGGGLKRAVAKPRILA